MLALVAGPVLSAETPLTVKVPKGLPPLPVPDNNKMTVEKVELGKMLYFDKRLSKDKTLSCATCQCTGKRLCRTKTGFGWD